MMKSLADHGLPLVQLKEQRRDLVVALQKRNGPINGWELMQIAAIQQAISAFEDVIADLDAEMEMEAGAWGSADFRGGPRLVFWVLYSRVAGKIAICTALGHSHSFSSHSTCSKQLPCMRRPAFPINMAASSAARGKPRCVSLPTPFRLRRITHSPGAAIRACRQAAISRHPASKIF